MLAPAATLTPAADKQLYPRTKLEELAVISRQGAIPRREGSEASQLRTELDAATQAAKIENALVLS